MKLEIEKLLKAIEILNAERPDSTRLRVDISVHMLSEKEAKNLSQKLADELEIREISESNGETRWYELVGEEHSYDEKLTVTLFYNKEETICEECKTALLNEAEVLKDGDTYYCRDCADLLPLEDLRRGEFINWEVDISG